MPDKRVKLKRGIEEDQEKVFKGRQCNSPIVYLNMDREQYPIPMPVGDLILAIRQDLARMCRELKKNGIKQIPLSSVSYKELVVRDIRRVPLELRCYMD